MNKEEQKTEWIREVVGLLAVLELSNALKKEFQHKLRIPILYEQGMEILKDIDAPPCN